MGKKEVNPCAIGKLKLNDIKNKRVRLNFWHTKKATNELIAFFMCQIDLFS